MTKCRANERHMAPMRKGLIQGGMTKRDWFSDRELIALAISIVTKMDRAIVMGSGDWKYTRDILNS